MLQLTLPSSHVLRIVFVSPIWPMQDRLHKGLPDCTREEFCENISRIFLSTDMMELQHLGSNGFSDSMVAEGIMSFLQSIFRNGGTVNNSQIVSKHHAWAFNRNTQHPQHIPHLHNLVCANPCSNKLTAISSRFNT